MHDGHPPERRTGRSARRRRAGAVLALAALLVSALGAPAAAAPTNPARTLETGESAPFVDEQVLYKQGDFGYGCFRIPAVVRATNGMLLAFAEGRVKDCGDDEDIDLVLRRSADGGRTWGPLQVVSEGNGATHGNPVPIVDERTGRVVLVSTHNGAEPCPNGCDRDPWVQVSDDHGATWSAAREMTEGKRPEWNFWYATGPMHGIQLKRGPHAGRLVVGASFESWDRVGKHAYGTHLLYSDDGGATWHIGAETSRDDGTVIAQEVTVVELTDGRIYASARERGTDEGNRAYATSSDGGETWDAPFRTMPALATTDIQGSLLRFGDGAASCSPRRCTRAPGRRWASGRPTTRAGRFETLGRGQGLLLGAVGVLGHGASGRRRGGPDVRGRHRHAVRADPVRAVQRGVPGDAERRPAEHPRTSGARTDDAGRVAVPQQGVCPRRRADHRRAVRQRAGAGPGGRPGRRCRSTTPSTSARGTSR